MLFRYAVWGPGSQIKDTAVGEAVDGADPQAIADQIAAQVDEGDTVGVWVDSNASVTGLASADFPPDATSRPAVGVLR